MKRRIGLLLTAVLFLAGCGNAAAPAAGEGPQTAQMQFVAETEEKSEINASAADQSPVTPENVTADKEGKSLKSDAGDREEVQPSAAPTPRFHNTMENYVPEAERKDKLGEVRSSFGLGSAGYLKGKNILVSLFVTTPESSFTEAEQISQLERLSNAVAYIERQAKEYGTDAEFIYDWKKQPELLKTAETDFCIREDADFFDRLNYQIYEWFETLISYDELLDAYGADGIATCIFVNNPGISYTLVYDGLDSELESTILFAGNYYEKGKPESAATCAHELLHLFGAHDLYKGAEYTGDVTEYLKQKYPDELMLDVDPGRNDTIWQTLSPITAYHLGWLSEEDAPEEIAQFPQLKRE